MAMTSDVTINRKPGDTLVSSKAVTWAISHLAAVLATRSLTVTNPEDSIVSEFTAPLHIQLHGANQPDAIRALQQSGIVPPVKSESFAIVNRTDTDTATLTLIAGDPTGMVYALTELADIAQYSADPMQALRNVKTFSDEPSNAVRSITRLFTSEPEDKPWFYDKSFWDEYLTELATQRFNRFTFSVGCGYDYLIDKIVLDNYFCFFYPFILSVPGYVVEVDGLADGERERNLEMIRYIGRQCQLRGLEFRLGLWNHSFDYGPGNTHEKYRIKGIDGTNHAEYCRDALALLLRTCPEIQGLTFRVHFEGGVPEPTHAFWKKVMSRIEEAENLIDIDFHSKGVTDELLEIMNRTGKKFNLSTKLWAEHMGPPYHQASIRNREFSGGKKPPVSIQILTGTPSTGHHESDIKGTETTQKRSFTRYGYADFLKEDRTYGIVHRVWPGTQRILTWGDPRMAAGIGRSAGFCGSSGIEWFEPLSFKGKKGSGVPDGRELYLPDDLKLGTRDWTKFRYTYRMWGRLSYNPKADPDSWLRFLRGTYGEAAVAVEQALGFASRILPFILLVHAPSVANNVYWPEMYTNIPLVRGSDTVVNPYAREGWSANADFDMEKPYNFMNTSPLDPVLVYKINEFAEDILQGKRCGKISPMEIADRLEDMAIQADSNLGAAQALVPDAGESSFRRLAADIRIMAGTGLFFARKFRAGLAFSLYEKTGSTNLLSETRKLYQSARLAWMQVVDASAGIYKSDITFGHPPYTRGHWADRIEGIDADIQAVEALLEKASPMGDPKGEGSRTLAGLLAPFQRGLRPVCSHMTPDGFIKGLPLEIRIGITDWKSPPQVILHYRHVDQSDDYRTVEMERAGDVYTAAIDAEYTDSPYALMYFFEIGAADGDSWMVPGLDEDLSNQPYYVIQSGQ